MVLSYYAALNVTLPPSGSQGTAFIRLTNTPLSTRLYLYPYPEYLPMEELNRKESLLVCSHPSKFILSFHTLPFVSQKNRTRR